MATSPLQTFPDPVDIFDHIDIAMVRDSAQYHYELHGDYTGLQLHEMIHNRDKIVKIQLGAGYKLIDGWRNLEYPDWDADKPIPAEGFSAQGHPRFDQFKSEIWKTAVGIQPDNSVHEIACYHTLDHLSPTQVINTLREVQRVLVPGGTFTNILPHADSQLAKECIHHQSRFMIDTWRNIFSERQYKHDGDDWKLRVGLNFTFALAERNTVLVTQLVKEA